MTGIYVASKVRHAGTWTILRDTGLPVISTWIDEAGVGQSDLRDLWRRCVAEVKSADVLLLYRLGGEILKGGWIEAGVAAGAGIPIYAVGIDEFTFAHFEGVTHFANLDAAVEAARSLLGIAPAAAAVPVLQEVS